MQITPKLLTLVKIFDSLNHSFNFYWQNNDSKNIHSKKNLIIHSSKIFIQKKKNIHSKKNSFKKKAEHSFKKNIHSKVFLIIHSMKIFIFLKKCRIGHPYLGLTCNFFDKCLQAIFVSHCVIVTQPRSTLSTFLSSSKGAHLLSDGVSIIACMYKIYLKYFDC